MTQHGKALVRLGFVGLLGMTEAVIACSPETSVGPLERVRAWNGVTTRLMTDQEVLSFLERKHATKAREALMTPRTAALTEAEDPPGDAIMYIQSASDASNFSASVSGAVWINAGHAVVQADIDSDYAQGRAVPLSYSDSCYGWDSCAKGRIWAINCEEDDFTVHGATTGQALWASAYAPPRTIRSGAMCTWPGSPGGGTSGPAEGSNLHCDYYITERSDDGGETWYVVETYSTCD